MLTFQSVFKQLPNRIVELDNFLLVGSRMAFNQQQSPMDAGSVLILPDTVNSQFNEWPPSAPFCILNRDYTLNRDFLT